jgi:1-acyl-sn-glycerol-3-phosphate acyltransferase
MSSLIRSILHMALMMTTVIPYALVVVAASALGVKGDSLYRLAQRWLILAVDSAQLIIGIRYKIHGENKISNENSNAVIYLVKHQSTYETFLLPAILKKPVAYVFKRELLNVPFFGWAIGKLDMIHIDRTQRAKAFTKIVEQGQNVLSKGVSVIMFPEGTRINRGEKGVYKTGGARLAIETGASIIPVAVTSAKCWLLSSHQV